VKAKVKSVFLIHWHQNEAEELASLISNASLQVTGRNPEPGRSLREVKAAAPHGILISLDRMPAHGREVAAVLLRSPATRNLPLLFVGGLPEKRAMVKANLPHVPHADWNVAADQMKQLLSKPHVAAPPPAQYMERFAERTVAQKLGVKETMKVGLVNEPEAWQDYLPAAVLSEERRGLDLLIWFVTRRTELEGRIDQYSLRANEGRLWIIYPKGASKIPRDVDQALIRQTALSSGLVDYKIAAIDKDWTGLLFRNKKL
jgi:hypothetical protein